MGNTGVESAPVRAAPMRPPAPPPPPFVELCICGDHSYVDVW